MLPAVINPETGRDIDGFDINQRRALKHMLERNHLLFTRYFFKHRDGTKFMVSPHHKLMAWALDEVIAGNITRLIINIPPGYTKTEMAVINFIAHGLAVNPQAKFIHVSYSDTLVLHNSTLIQDIVRSDEFQSFWPMKIRLDKSSKKEWSTDLGGEILAVPSGGTITGFRAGRLQPGRFTGAFVIDDPMKPDDAFSATMRDKVNMRFTNTYASRLAHEGIPFVIVMQRIHEDDTTGFLLKGGNGDMWHHLQLPVEITENMPEYPREFTHGIPVDISSIPVGPLWETKHTLEQIRKSAESDPYTHSSQYDQRPAPLGGSVFKDGWWKFYDGDPTVDYCIITCDTAQRTKEHNDFSVFQLWGSGGGRIYLLDQRRGKWEAPDLRRELINFYYLHKDTHNIRCVYVEAKASGTGLVQDIRHEPSVSMPIMPIERANDKLTRAMDAVPYIASGYVYLPRVASFLPEYLAEMAKFTAKMTHTHDDQVDATVDGIDLLLREDSNWCGVW